MASVIAAEPRVTRALLYDRVSTQNQARSGHSGGAEGFQLDRGRRHAAGRGYVVVGEISDVDSGAEWNIDGIMQALDMAKRREYDVLVVSETSRFARNLAKKTVYEAELRRSGVDVEYLNLPANDGPEGRFMSNIFGALDEYDRERRAWWGQQGRLRKAEKGQVVGCGPAPYGYQYAISWDEFRKKDIPRGLEPDPATAPIVRRLFAEIQQMPTAAIAARLRAEGIPGPRRQWSDAAILRIVTSSTYFGRWIYGHRGRRIRPDDESDGSFIVVPVPPLVDRPVWAAAQEALARRRWVRPPRRPVEEDAWLLRGMLTCAHCGGALSTRTNTSQGSRVLRYYACLRSYASRVPGAGGSLCPARDIFAPPLEEIAWRLASDTLLDPDRLQVGLAAARSVHDQADARRREHLATLDCEVTRLRERLTRIIDQRLDVDPGGETDRALLARARETEAAIGRLLAEREALERPAGGGLSQEAACSIAQFSRKVRAGIQMADPADRRRVFQILDLRARVRLDPSGIKIARRHRYALSWSAKLRLVDNAGGVNDHLVTCFRYDEVRSA